MSSLNPQPIQVGGFEQKIEDRLATPEQASALPSPFSRQIGMINTSEISEEALGGQTLDERIKDKKWRMENLYFITDADGNLTKFRPNRVQRRFFSNLHNRNIILKARQLGMSTAIAIYFLDEILFNKNKSAAIVADKVDSAENIFKKIDHAWKKLDPKVKELLKIRLTSDSTKEMEFSNGSSIKVGTTIHSGTYQYLHISEYGPLCATSPDKADAVKKSAFPTVPTEGKLFVESTAEGENNEFHQMCVDAMALDNQLKAPGSREINPLEFRFFFFPWFDDDKYEMKSEYPIPPVLQTYFKDLQAKINRVLPIEKQRWYALKAKDLKERMKEQYPSTPDEAFLSTGNTLFNVEVVRHKMDMEIEEPKESIGDLIIYNHYQKGHAYGIGGDVALGIGRDSSAAVVIDFTLNKVVATYRSNTVDPVLFAYELAKIGRIYGACVIAPESNNMGHTTCVTLAEVYPNVYQYELKGNNESVITKRLGWSSNTSTKPRMMYELSAAFEDEQTPLVVPDMTILREAYSYKKEDTLVTTLEQEKKTTRHFDLLTACAIAWQLRSHAHVSFSRPEQVSRVERIRERVRQGGRRFN